MKSTATLEIHSLQFLVYLQLENNSALYEGLLYMYIVSGKIFSNNFTLKPIIFHKEDCVYKDMTMTMMMRRRRTMMMMIKMRIGMMMLKMVMAAEQRWSQCSRCERFSLLARVCLPESLGVGRVGSWADGALSITARA